MSSIAVVKSIVGQVFALSPDGARRLLIEGDRLFAGDQVITGPEGMISLELSDGRTLDLGRDSQWTAVDDAQPAAAAANAELSVSELQQAISLGLDPTAELEATAAGGGGAGAGGGAAGGGNSFVLLDATAQQVDPTVGYPTAGLDFAASGAEEQLGQADSNTPAADNPPIDANTPPVALSAVISTEENAVLNNQVPPASDIDGTIVPNGYALVSGPGANNGSLIFNADGSYSFTPGTDFDALTDGESRDVTFTYTATDNDGAVSAPATITITVTGTNDAPTTNDVAVAGDEDTTIAIALSGSDVDGSLNGFVITNLPANGTLYLDAAGTQPISAGTSVNTSTVYFKPTTNWSGDTAFQYAALDNGGATDTTPATVSISVNPISDTPTLAAAAVSGNEDSPIALNIASALTDTDGSETLSIRLDGIPVGAVLSNTAGDTLTISGGGIVLTPAQLAGLAITPPANSHADFDLTVTAIAVDGSAAPASTATTLTVTVNPVTDLSAANDSASTDEDVPVINASVAGNDSTTSGGTLTYAVVSGVSNGTLTFNSDGSYSYTPNGNYSGPDSFTYTVTDAASGESLTQTVSLTVNPISDTPTLAATAVSGNEDSPIALNIAAALTDTDGSETLSIRLDGIPVGAVLSNTAGDTLTISGGSIVLTPAQLAGLAITPPANSHADFDLTVTAIAVDGSAAPASTDTTLTVTVNPVNDAPVAVANTVRVGEDDDDQVGFNDNSASTTIIGGNVLSNDVDIDSGDSITVTGVAAGTPISASGNVSSSVTGTYGSVNINADGSYTYTLDNSKPEVQALAFKQFVTDTFTYTITDSQGATSSTTLTVYVNGKNDAPVITIGAGTDSANASLAETNSGLITTGTLSIFDVDTTDTVTVSTTSKFSVDGSYNGPRPSDALLKAMFSVSGGEPSATEQGNPHGINWSFNSGSEAFNFIPAGQTLVLHYTVRAKDSNSGTGNIVDQPVTITITGSNDAAVIAGSTTGTVIEDNPNNSVSGTLTATDADNSSNLFQAISTPTASQNGYGTFTVTSDGAWTYNLDNSNSTVNALNNAGTLSDTFIVRSADGTAQTITVTINGNNDAPTTAPVTLGAIAEDSGTRLITQAELLGNASDVDGPSLTASNLTIASGNGSLISNGDGTWNYTPAANDDSSVTFNYSVTDGSLSANGSASLDLTPVNDASAPTLTLATKGQWTFNEAQGSSTTLNGTTGQSGTLSDNDSAGGSQLPSFITNGRNDTSGNNISFNDNGDRVDVSADATQALLGTSSLTFWVNTTQVGGASGAGNSWSLPTVLGSEQSGGRNDIQWGAINDTGKIGFGIGNVNGVYSTTTVSDGNWHHITITRDASSKLVQIYVDGNLEAQGNPDDAAFTGTLNRLTSLGANNNFANDASASDLADNRYFQGKLDDLRIYSQVLTAAQVAAIRSVESGFHDTAIANDGSVMSLALTPGNYTALAVTGLVSGMLISDGNGNSQTATSPDQSIDLTGWNLGNLQLSNAGTASATLVFTATNTVNGDSASTQQYLTIANGSSQLSQLGNGNDSLTGTAEADLLRGDNGVDTLSGGAGADRLEGGNGTDTLNGDAGNDVLIGDAGNDILFGGNDNDIMNGGSDSDSLRGGLGNDILTGGSGADTFIWKSGDTGNDVIKDFNPAAGDRIDLHDLLQGETDATLSNFLQIDTTSNSLLISSTGQLNAAGGTVASHADTTIKLDGFDLSSTSISSLIAGADPTIKVDHS
ncbi:MAG: retention module-containing protein [Pseudomonas sp.]|nr:retention module-containing protein [Pseudomonas sp.]